MNNRIGFVLLMIAFSLSIGAFGNIQIDYRAIMRHVESTPGSVSSSTAKLSDYLCSPYSSDEEKFASIFYWVAKNIAYNDVLAKKAIFYEDVNEIVDQVMKTKSGVCQHFAELLARLGQESGLEVYVVNGYTRTDGLVDNLTHAWNILKVSGKWYFIDATWAGSSLKTIYKNQFPRSFFMMTAAENMERRMPFDPIWQGLTSPVKYNDFDMGLEDTSKKGKFDFNDSINVFLKLNLIQRQIATMNRMKTNGRFNSLVKREYDLMEKNYKMLLFNQEVLKYNQGTSFYNNGIRFFNEYVKVKNNKTNLQKYSKQRLKAMIDSSSINLEKAKGLFEEVNTDNAEMNTYIKKNDANIKKVNAILEKELKFVQGLPR